MDFGSAARRWLHEAIPVPGGLSPVEAVRQRSGRAKVEALIAQIARDGRRMNPPLGHDLHDRLRFAQEAGAS